jgi:hypothetical protein
MKNASLEEWQQIGTQAKKVREELFVLQRLSSGHMPSEIVGHITRAISSIDKYKSKAEDRMMQSGVSKDIKVFYGL